MDMNKVQLSGTVKRDAEAGRFKGGKAVDFALVVEMEDGYKAIFDCRLTDRAEAFADLEGFVEEGEHMEVIGHLGKNTSSKEVKALSAAMTVRVTDTIVYVDEIVAEDEYVD